MSKISAIIREAKTLQILSAKNCELELETKEKN